MTPEVEPYVRSLLPLLETVSESSLVEAPVLHEGLGFAGTVDLVARVHGEQYLIDWKTAAKPKQRPEHLYDYPLQSAAYLGAVSRSYPDIKVSKVLIVFALPDQQAQLWEFSREEMLVYWGQWLERLHEFRETVEVTE